VKSRRDFLSFGEDLFNGVGARSELLKYGSNTDDIKQKFTGYLKDTETGLDFAEARMYENRHGRFTAVDPLLASGKSANPQTFNRYIYVGNNPIITTDPLGLDWYSNGNRFQWSADNKVWDDGTAIDKDWSSVQFDSTGYYAYNCEGCASGEQAYLYQIGGWDNGRRAQIYDSMMENVRLANSFNDPKYLASRDSQVRDAASDVMGMSAAFLNKPSETYNFAAWGANKFGANLPYAPTLEPDENTRGGAQVFYYGANAGLAVQGGVSAFRGIKNFFSGPQIGTKLEYAFGNATGSLKNLERSTTMQQ
jgi:RHS repeat-associated protein